MAISKVNSGSYKTTLTDSVSELSVSVSTDTDDKRVTYIRVLVTPKEGESMTPYAETKKKAVHTAIVTAVEGKMGDGI